MKRRVSVGGGRRRLLLIVLGLVAVGVALLPFTITRKAGSSPRPHPNARPPPPWPDGWVPTVSTIRNLTFPIRSFVLPGATIGSHSVDRYITPPTTFAAPPVTDESVAELKEVLPMVDLVYTWVNGTEAAVRLRKLSRQGYEEARGWKPGRGETLAQLIDRVVRPDSRDRDVGELHASMRSVAANMQWHHGRQIIVSPGQIPSFVDPRALFLGEDHRHGTVDVARHRGRNQAEVHRRLVVVHQDALTGDTHRGTTNSNGLEPYLHLIPRISTMFIHFNDDYLVVKPTTLATFFNRFGGPILLFENAPIRGGESELNSSAAAQNAWHCACFGTNGQVNRMLDDRLHGSVFKHVFGEVRNDDGSPRSERLTTRFYIKHAPYVYSASILQYLQSADAGLTSRFERQLPIRTCLDLLTPYLHHAVAMDAPWRGYQPQPGAESRSTETLHWSTGTAPALAKIGAAAQAQYLLLTDSVNDTERHLKELREATNPARNKKYVFYSVNDNYSKPAIAEMLTETLAKLFPHPTWFEQSSPQAHPPPLKELGHLETRDLFRRRGGKSPFPPNLMLEALSTPRASVIALVSSVDFVCPVLRSIAFALPTFRGLAHFIMPKGTGGASLTERTRLNDSPTVDLASSFNRSGYESADPSNWIPLCHLRADRVTLTEIDAKQFAAFNDSLLADAVERETRQTLEMIQFASSEEQIANVRARVEAEHNLTASERLWVVLPTVDPVLGQTITFHDLDFIDQLGTPRVATELFVYAPLGLRDRLALIAPGTALDMLLAYPVPSPHFETQPGY